jgi:hypothetical protein
MDQAVVGEEEQSVRLLAHEKTLFTVRVQG